MHKKCYDYWVQSGHRFSESTEQQPTSEEVAVKKKDEANALPGRKSSRRHQVSCVGLHPADENGCMHSNRDTWQYYDSRYYHSDKGRANGMKTGTQVSMFCCECDIDIRVEPDLSQQLC
jgi:hypothetical protein